MNRYRIGDQNGIYEDTDFDGACVAWRHGHIVIVGSDGDEWRLFMAADMPPEPTLEVFLPGGFELSGRHH
mgnify:CR=1 FL=1